MDINALEFVAVARFGFVLVMNTRDMSEWQPGKVLRIFLSLDQSVRATQSPVLLISAVEYRQTLCSGRHGDSDVLFAYFAAFPARIYEEKRNCSHRDVFSSVHILFGFLEENGAFGTSFPKDTGI